jgi:hypothetical protein
MAMSITLPNLREIARRCIAGLPLDRSLAHWLGRALQGYLDHRYPSIEQALGIMSFRGGIPWWRAEANRERDTALRTLAGLECPDSPVAVQARHVRMLSIRYAACAWRRDRDLDEMPAHYQGCTLGCLWQAFKSGATMPIGDRQLRNILRR